MTTAVTLRRFFVRSDLVVLLVKKLLSSILVMREAGRRQRIRSDQKMLLNVLRSRFDMQKKKASLGRLFHLPSLGCCTDMDRLRSAGGTKRKTVSTSLT